VPSTTDVTTARHTAAVRMDLLRADVAAVVAM
jgi:hypothetical protein